MPLRWRCGFDADRLDIDRYAPDGFTMVSEEANPVLAGIDIVARSMGLGDFHFTANAGRLKLNGVEAEDVAIDMGANENGIEFRTVDVGNVAGARLDMTGLLQFPKQAVAGSINAKVTASDPQGLFRLLGLAGRGDTATIYDRLAALKPLRSRCGGPGDLRRRQHHRQPQGEGGVRQDRPLDQRQLRRQGGQVEGRRSARLGRGQRSLERGGARPLGV